MKYNILAALLALTTALTAHAQAPMGSANAQDVIFFSSRGPLLIRMQIEVDGNPATTVLRDYFQKWVAFLDRDGDKLLNAQEIGFLPRGNYTRNFFRSGSFSVSPNTGLRMSDLGKGAGDKASVDDLLDYYEKYGLSSVQVGLAYNRSNSQNPANEELYNQLDANSDGQLSKQELAAGLAVLQQFDLNDDELISLQELSSNPYTTAGSGRVIVFNQSGGGNINPNSKLNSTPFYVVPPSKSPAQLTVKILSKYDKNGDKHLNDDEVGLDNATFRKFDINRDSRFSVVEMMSWLKSLESVPVTVRLGKTKPNQSIVAMDLTRKQMPQSVLVSKGGDDNVHLLLEDAKISIHGEGQSQQMMMTMARNYMMLLYQRANVKNKAFLEMKDLQGAQYRILANAFPAMDRDADGKLTRLEVEELAKLQMQARNATVTLSVREEGRALFQLLDANRDGKLSPRELITGWSNLAPLDRNEDGQLSGKEFAKQYVVMVSLGQSIGYRSNFNNPLPSPTAKSSAKGPLWFQKMDANGDGDVSAREFLGSAAHFQKIDADRDGLIDAQEAREAMAAVTNSGN